MSAPESMTLSLISSTTTIDSSNTVIATTQRTATPTFVGGEGMGYLVTTDLESIFTTPTEPTEADVAEYLRIFDGIQVPLKDIKVQYMNNLTSVADYNNFLWAQHGTDPQDCRVKNALFGDLDLGWYRTPFHKYRRYIPREGSLQEVDPGFVPYDIREIRCLAITHTQLLPFTLTTGTLIPAGLCHGRAMVLTPLFQDSHIHYVLCFHGARELFLIRANEGCMAPSWSTWDQMRKIYGQGTFRALFSAGGDTLQQRMQGIRCQQKWQDWEINNEPYLEPDPSFWAEAWKFCTWGAW